TLASLTQLSELVSDPGRGTRDLGSLTLTLSDGTAAGSLSWRQPRPGDAILLWVLPLLLGVAGGVGFLGWRSWHRSRSVAAALAASERRARLLEQVDPLTGLPNRAFFGAWLARALVRA